MNIAIRSLLEVQETSLLVWRAARRLFRRPTYFNEMIAQMDVIGVGSLAFGLVLMFVWYLFPRSKRFFRGESLNRDTQVMVPDEPGEVIRSIDGGI